MYQKLKKMLTKFIPQNNNFFTAFLTLLLSIGTFYIFKAVAGEVFSETPVHREIAEEQNSKNDNIVVDSVAATEPGKPSFKALVRFFKKLFVLEKTKKGSVRIAYFGDSMIEADIIVQAVRKNYQDKFGGQGIGFVPLSSLADHFGGGIRYEFSPDWSLHSALESSPVSPGITGYVSLANDGGSVWTNYKSGSLPLAHPTLFYGRSDNSNAEMIVYTGNSTLDTVPLKPTGILNKRSLASWTNELKIQFHNAGSIPFYGVNFSGFSGVNVDDFALRSSSGLPLGKLNISLMNAFHRELDYDLLILHFGANVLKPKVLEYDWYADNMTIVIDHLKKCFPGADILIISEADKATKYGTEMKTDTMVTTLIRAQEKYAFNTGSAFINLFNLMGGEGSMIKWVNENPSMANPDYTHFNRIGGKKIGNLIFEILDKEYEKFKISEENGEANE